MALRQPELRVEDRLLALKLWILTIKIETDLTDGDKFVSCGLHDLIKPLNVLIKMPLNHNRMQAERGIERGVPRGKIQHPGKIGRFDCRHNDGLNACLSRFLDALLFIPRKRREIKVAVGIDKAERHARSSLSSKASFACGISTSGVVRASLATIAGGKIMRLWR